MRKRCRGAFSLIETALAVIIVGIGVLASMELIATGTRVNVQSMNSTTGLNLAANIRESLGQATVSSAQALDGSQFSPPIDAFAEPLPILEGWSQEVDVVPVAEGNLTIDLPSGSSSEAVRLIVTVKHNQVVVYKTAWLITGGG